MAVLVLKKNASAIIDGQHHHRPRMANHVATRANAAGFFYVIGGDVKHGSLESNAGREDARAGTF